MFQKKFAGCNLVRATALIDIPDENITLWVKYYIESPKGQLYINNNLNTTVQPTLNIKSLEEMPIPFYEMDYIKKSISILSIIDNKIALNTSINENLIEQALTLYTIQFTGLCSCGCIGDYCLIKSGYAFKSSWWTKNGIKVIKIGSINQDNFSFLFRSQKLLIDRKPRKIKV